MILKWMIWGATYSGSIMQPIPIETLTLPKQISIYPKLKSSKRIIEKELFLINKSKKMNSMLFLNPKCRDS